SGACSGTSLPFSVTVSGLSGLTKAYTPVLSAAGSLEIAGASRWDDMSWFTFLQCVATWLTLLRGRHEAPDQLAVADDDLACADEECDLAGLAIAHVRDD